MHFRKKFNSVAVHSQTPSNIFNHFQNLWVIQHIHDYHLPPENLLLFWHVHPTTSSRFFHFQDLTNHHLLFLRNLQQEFITKIQFALILKFDDSYPHLKPGNQTCIYRLLLGCNTLRCSTPDRLWRLELYKILSPRIWVRR